MRIIIEVEPGTTVTGITSDSGTPGGAHDAVDTGPPRLGGDAADFPAAAAQEVPGPPEDLIRQVEAARATSATQ